MVASFNPNSQPPMPAPEPSPIQKAQNAALAEYFANKHGDDLAQALWKKIEDYRLYITSSGRLVLWQNLYEAFYREYWMSGTNEKGGSHGQYTFTRINQFKSLLERLKSIILQQRLKWNARSSNSDSQSLKQAILANSLLDYYLRTKRVESQIDMAVMWGLILGEGYCTTTWDSQSGQVVGQHQEADGTVINLHEGDVKVRTYDPTCVIRNPQSTSWNAADWVMLIDRVNKYDEAAKYPEFADQIVGLSLERSDEQQWHFEPNWWVPDDSMIAVYYFYHKKTPACPAGRYAKFYSDNLVVLETALPYETIPVHRFAPAEHLNTPFGYSVSINLMPMQECYDVVANSIMTNHELFGVQSVVGYEGSNAQFQQLPNGANYIEIVPVPGVADSTPRGLNLMDVKADSYEFLNKLEALMEIISGVNSVARGIAPQDVTAGVSLALLQSMALQSNSAAQQSYVQFAESMGTGIIRILREYAAVPRIAEIAGQQERTFVKEFSSQDLDKIQRVLIELGNPLTDTYAGRLTLAQDLLSKNLITTPQQYLSVMNTGNLEIMTGGDEAELLLIKKENELLGNQQSVQAMEFDAHQIHINEHKAVLADPEARANPQLVALVKAHIEAHEQFQQMNALQQAGAPPPSVVPTAPAQQNPSLNPMVPPPSSPMVAPTAAPAAPTVRTAQPAKAPIITPPAH